MAGVQRGEPRRCTKCLCATCKCGDNCRCRRRVTVTYSPVFNFFTDTLPCCVSNKDTGNSARTLGHKELTLSSKNTGAQGTHPEQPGENRLSVGHEPLLFSEGRDHLPKSQQRTKQSYMSHLHLGPAIDNLPAMTIFVVLCDSPCVCVVMCDSPCVCVVMLKTDYCPSSHCQRDPPMLSDSSEKRRDSLLPPALVTVTMTWDLELLLFMAVAAMDLCLLPTSTQFWNNSPRSALSDTILGVSYEHDSDNALHLVLFNTPVGDSHRGQPHHLGPQPRMFPDSERGPGFVQQVLDLLLVDLVVTETYFSAWPDA
uniref:Uncharacterized protein n=1 Tax=Timema douglasi TaxID=61478 RepID=A0A7R8VSY1_TIMDO|nr:unnamed protein product [Timema douglasi]